MSDKKITIAMGFQEDGWRSSLNQARQLYQSVRLDGYEIELFSPKLHHKPRWVDRRIHYKHLIPESDLFHLIDPAYADAIPFAKRRCKKVIVTVTDLAFWKQRNLINFYFRKKILDGIKSADYITTVSKKTQNELQSVLSIEKSKVIYMGTEPDLFPDKRGVRGEKLIIHVGTCDERKGLDRLIRIVSILPEGWRLVQIGGRFSQDQRQLMGSLQCSKRIEQIEAASLQHLVEYYQRGTVLIFPSRYEGYGIPCVEARLCGLPVIADPNSVPASEVLSEDPGFKGYDFTPFDHNQIPQHEVDKLLKVLSELEGEVKALPNRDRYSWSHSATEFGKLYREVSENI